MENAFSHAMSVLRHRKGVSQRKAAADLKISQALLSHYENGAREPGLDFICRACRYYGVSADYMLGLSESPNSREDGLESLSKTLKQLGELSAMAQEILEEVRK